MSDVQLWSAGEVADARLELVSDGSGRGVLVLPGGGYWTCAPHEGVPVARRLAEAGFGSAVLTYRHGPTHRHPEPIHDAQRAVRVLRHRGWEHIAVLGFSAGGHLAATAAVHHGRFRCPEDDLADRVSARPDAAVLAYPVIDLAGSAAHSGSRQNLLGPDAPADLADLLSLHRHVTADTPPTLVWHTCDDPGVPLDNALLMTAACRAAGVPVELHAYESGPHGVGLADGSDGRPPHPSLRTWIDHAVAFLDRHLQG